jgi:hypothetical protein
MLAVQRARNDRTDAEYARLFTGRTRRAFQRRARRARSGRFIFLDEFGTNLGLTRRDGRARRGQRAAGRAPVNVGPNVTLTMGLSREGAVAPLVFDGGTDGARFKACLREQLAPHSAGAMWWWPTGWAPTGVAPRGRRSKRAVRASGCCRRTRRT